MTVASKLSETGTSTKATIRKLAGFRSTPVELAQGLREIEQAFPHRFNDAPINWKIEFEKDLDAEVGFTVSIDSHVLRIAYAQPANAFRALGILMGQIESDHTPTPFSESSPFHSIGAMLDVSRNGVLRLESVYKFIRHLALMGINQLMLYTEDTFEIPDEPTFGYFRGGYSQEDLRAIDVYAACFGIEVIPCIQTLGHLEQILQWPCYHDLKDTNGVLLAGDKRTDDFIEKMITAASAPFRSRRIHLGMDEAHGIGSGIYRLKNGLRAPFDILCEHLKKTVATCERHGLKPMIWSDMFFRLGSSTNHYYDRESRIDSKVAEEIPQEVQLVYWDYYHTDTGFYDEWIARHRQLGKQPIFACGIWTWHRFWAQLPYSIATLQAGMASARRQNLDEVFITMWGDDGMECDLFSALPAVQVFADLAYGVHGEGQSTHIANFLGSVGGTFDDWLAGSMLDILPVESSTEYEANASKWILWHDPLLGHFECQILPEYLEHFTRVSEKLERVLVSRQEDTRLQFVQQVAKVIALKVKLHLTLRSSYQNNDYDALQRLHEDTIKNLKDAFARLRDMHNSLWHSNYRCFGWDVLERRYAGLLSRLETLHRKLGLYLDNHLDCIEELECKPQRLWPHEQTQSLTISHRQTSTPTVIY